MKQSIYHRKWNLKINPVLHPHTQNALAAAVMMIDAVTLYQAFEIGMDNSRSIVVMTIVGLIWVIDGIMYVMGNILTYGKKRMIALTLILFACVGIVFAYTWQTRSASADVRTVSAIEEPSEEKHKEEYQAYADKKEKANSAFNQNMQFSLQMVTVCSTVFMLVLTYGGTEARHLWADMRQYRALEGQEYAIKQELMDIQNQTPLRTQLALSRAEAKAKIQQLDTENRVWIDQQKLRIAASTGDARALDFSFHKKTDEEESV